MNLADMLSYADIHQLSSIAGNYDCDCNGHSKNELIQSILTAMNRRERFEQYIYGLSTEDMRFLNSLLFDQRDSFSLEELIARVRQTMFDNENKNDINPRDMITKFKQRGWLFNGYSQQTKYLFQVPKDLKRRFGETLAKHFTAKLTIADEPSVYREEHKIIADDIYHFLHYLYHHEVTLTADGSMYRRFLQQLLDRMAVKEEPVAKGGWRFGYGRHFKEYPNRLSFIYDYCFYNDLIRELKDSLQLTDQGKNRVIEGKKEDLLQVYRLWLRLYKNPINNLQSVVHWIEALCKNWVTLESLKGVLCTFIKPFYYDGSETILEQRVIYMMMHLGLLRVGEHEDHGKVVRITKLGSSVINGINVADEDKIDIPVESNTSLW